MSWLTKLRKAGQRAFVENMIFEVALSGEQEALRYLVATWPDVLTATVPKGRNIFHVLCGTQTPEDIQ